MTTKKHILILGVPGSGKTTLVQRIINELKRTSIPAGGFFSEELRNANNQRIGFDIVSVTDGEIAPLARVQGDELDINEINTVNLHKYPEEFQNILRDPVVKNNASKNKLGKYIVYTQALDSFAVPLLQGFPDEPGVVFIDEIGKMESFSKHIFTKIAALLPNENNVIVATACATGKPIKLVEQFKKHPNFRVIHLEQSNRSWLHEDIITHILPLMENY